MVNSTTACELRPGALTTGIPRRSGSPYVYVDGAAAAAADNAQVCARVDHGLGNRPDVCHQRLCALDQVRHLGWVAQVLLDFTFADKGHIGPGDVQAGDGQVAHERPHMAVKGGFKQLRTDKIVTDYGDVQVLDHWIQMPSVKRCNSLARCSQTGSIASRTLR